MLQSLSIKNFALVEELEVNWTSGLNVLTGETGAGKSVLIDAISLLLGAKGSPTLIRAGAEKAQIEGAFLISPHISTWLIEQELADGAGEELIVFREITKSGSRFRINGTLVNQSLAQDLRQFLVNIHAQHEARTLMSSQTQLAMLDALGDEKHAQLVLQVRDLAKQKKELEEQLKSFQISEEERVKRLDFARFQFNELTEAQLAKPDEDSELNIQVSVLSNVVELNNSTSTARQFLIGGASEAHSSELNQSAVDFLQAALNDLEQANKLDPNLEEILVLLQSSLAQSEEAATKLRKYHDTLETNPEALQAIESRIAQLATIKRKYGPALEDAIKRREDLEKELEQLENAQVHLGELNTKYAALQKELENLANLLSERRQALGTKLSKRVEIELAQLGMERCRFEISFEAQVEIGLNGKDRIEFMIAPNPGQPLMPLAKIASGGELSRIMLVIKSIFAEADQVATVVFDEIDTGLSGRVLQSMRDKLASLAKSHQILCITHQPIIAAVADNHLEISKAQTAQTTKVSIKVLREDDRLKALAAMASGQEDQEVAISFARSLIAQAEQVRG